MHHPIKPPHPRVLLVEDDTHIRQLMQFVLTRAGYEVLVASRRSEAEALMAENTFDVAVLDLCLPDGSGDQIALSLRDRAPDTRIVMTSAVAHTSASRQAATEVSDTFLPKPFSNAALISAVAVPSEAVGASC
jgi:DNA-binding response OmpR family regulator